MKKIALFFLLTVSLVCLAATFAFAQTEEYSQNENDSVFVSQKFNFSIEKPRDWVWKENIAKYVARSIVGEDVEVEGISMLKLRHEHDCVFTLMTYIETDTAALSTSLDTVANYMLSLFIETGCCKKLGIRKLTIEKKPAISIRFKCKFTKEQVLAEEDLNAIMDYVFLINKDIVYIFLRTARDKEFKKVETDFQKIIDSFHFLKR